MKNPMLSLFGFKTKVIFICLVILTLALSEISAFFIAPVWAQQGETAPVPAVESAPTAPVPAAPAETDIAEPTASPESVPSQAETDLPPEVLADMQVSTADLGAKEADIKPDSFWHPFKQLGRNIHEALVFDPVNDAELKLRHANQELAEIKQLVQEKGMENIDPKILTDSVNWFENKLEKIKDASLNIKDKKGDKPAEVEDLLNDFTDKHFYEHKILEEFDEKITNAKNQITGAEDVYMVLKDKQDEMLEDFGSLLTIVDDPEKISERLSNVANAQEGSEFKLIKATEILKKLEEQVPEQAKDAIEQAQEKTMKLLEQDIGELAPVLRAEKFEQYTNALPGDETVHLSIFEQLKQMPDIPQDMLEKIEQVKEFAVQKFEKKIEKFEKKEVKDKFFEKLTGDDLSDIMVLEELKAKITTQQEELRKRVEAKHIEGLETFKKQFTDLKSQEQAKHFEKLVKEMTGNPNPRTLQLIQGLEMEMAGDPEKAAFIENIKNKTKAEFENKFRQEGERFFDRVSTLNPADMAVFQEFKQQEFFDPKMMDEFLRYQTELFKQYIQNIDNSDSFNRFQERFRYVPQEVIETIKTQDESFGEMMQYKSRKMEEMELEKKEREVNGKMNDAWRQMENEFQNKLNNALSDETRKTLFEEKRKKDLGLVEKEYTERYALMKERMTGDPFCDEKCREIQIYYFDQEFANKKNNIMNEGLKRDFETSMKPEIFGNPFAGKCDKPGDCLTFCQTNPDFSACKMFAAAPPAFTSILPAGEPFPGIGPMGPPPCPLGQINMPKGPGQWVCLDDPYWKMPENFKQCPPGHIWNDVKGFCEFKEDMFKPVMPTPGKGCPAGERWDPGRNSCIREQGPSIIMPINFCGQGEYWDNTRGCIREDFKQCGKNEYFDFYEKRCLGGTSCPQGEYWDPSRDSCIKDVFVPPTEQCKPGYFWDFYKKQCVEDKYQPPYPRQPIACPTVIPRPCKPGEVPAYGPCGPSCTISSACPEGQWWDSTKNACISGTSVPYPIPQPIFCTEDWQPVCGNDNITYSNECYAKKAGVSIKFRGECTPTPIPTPTPMPIIGYCGDGVCKNGETMTSCPKDCGGGAICNYNGTCDNGETTGTCPKDCGGATTGYCGDGSCQSSETSTSCSSDCGGSTTCPSTIYNNYSTGFVCNYTKCPNGCNLDYQGCPNGCMSYKGYCGDNVCDSNETTTSCPGDCHGTTTGYCGDGSCQSSETSTSCPSDCGGTGSCPLTKYNNNTTGFTCSYSACPNGCTFDSKGCPTGCQTTSGCNTYYSQSTCTSYGCIWCSDTNSCYNQGHVCAGTSNYCGNKVCDSGETTSSCPSDCGGTTTGWCGDGICQSSETSSSCSSDCRGGTMTCNNYASLGQGCNPSTGTCCSEGTCSNMSGPGSCVSSGGTTSCNYNGTCDSNETMSSCSSDCGSASSCPSTIYNNYSSGFACNYSNCPNGCTFDSKGCPTGCTASTGYCGDGTCGNNESQASCPSDCGGYTPPPSSVCGNGICEGSEGSYSCPNDCGAPPVETPPPTETPPPPTTEPPPGEVLGVMSGREADEIMENHPLTVIEKMWQIAKAIFNKDRPATKPVITAYLPHQVLRTNPSLKSRILWTEGNNYYRLISYHQPEVLGAKTRPKIKFPLITAWEILSATFK